MNNRTRKKVSWRLQLPDALLMQLRLIAGLAQISVDSLIIEILEDWLTRNESILKEDSLPHRLKGFVSHIKASKPKQFKIRAPMDIKDRLLLISMLDKEKPDRLLSYILLSWLKSNRKMLVGSDLAQHLKEYFKSENA